MSNREKDPSRCRELRRIEDTIRHELSQASENSEQTWRMMEALRADLGRFRERSELLQRQLAAVVAASAIRGPAGATLGASVANIEFQREFLRQEIDRSQNQLQHLENYERRLRRDHERWQAALEENAQRMDALSCVR